MLKTFAVRSAITAVALGGLLAQTSAVAAPTMHAAAAAPLQRFTPTTLGRPLAAATQYYVYGGTLAAAQWRTWLAADPQGCYTPVGTGEAQNAFYSGNIYQTVGTGLAGDCGYTYSYPRVDFAAGDAPLTSYRLYYYNQLFLSKRGPAIVVPVAGAAIAEPYSTLANGNGVGLPSRVQIANSDLCKIWTGVTTDWTNVTNTVTGGRVTNSSLPITLVVRSDGSGSSFIHSAHLNAICSGGYPVGTSFPTTIAGAKVVAVKGSGAVATTVAATPGAIGYVGPQYITTNLTETAAVLQNRAGFYKLPTPYALSQAYSSPLDATPPPNYPAPSGTQVDLYLTNPSSADAYPEVGFTYLYLYKCYPTASGSPLSPSTAFLRSLFIKNYTTTPTEAGIGQLPTNIANAAFAAINKIGTGTAYSTTTGQCHF